jgi:hypothetical protein
MCYEHLLFSLARAEHFHRFVEASLLRLSLLAEEGRGGERGEAVEVEVDDGEVAQGGSRAAAEGESSAASASLIAASKGCLSAACELSQRSIAQLLNLRKDTTSRQLSLDKVLPSPPAPILTLTLTLS